MQAAAIVAVRMLLTARISLRLRTVTFLYLRKASSIFNVHVKKSVSPLLDAEAVRVVTAMPKWNPGINNGKPVRVTFDLTVSFKIPKENKRKCRMSFIRHFLLFLYFPD